MSENEATHRIRLNGPWEVHPEAYAGDAPYGRMIVPTTLGESGWAGCRGHICLRRRFGKPTGLTNERVWLVFTGIAGQAKVALNDKSLGMVHSPLFIEITALLRERNELDVVLDAKDDQCGIVGDVVLEIRSTVE
jgi:hypothetical protein